MLAMIIKINWRKSSEYITSDGFLDVMKLPKIISEFCYNELIPCDYESKVVKNMDTRRTDLSLRKILHGMISELNLKLIDLAYVS